MKAIFLCLKPYLFSYTLEIQTPYILEVFIQHNKIRLFVLYALIQMYQNFYQATKITNTYGLCIMM